MQKVIYTRTDQKELKKYTERFGKCKCLYLGEDDMTFEKLLELNYKFAQEEK